MEYYAAAHTTIGRRQLNQDSAYVRIVNTVKFGQVLFAVICDGMGGLKYGEIASSSVAAYMARWFDDFISTSDEINQSTIYSIWSKKFYYACKTLSGIANGAERMGTTLTCMLMCNGEYYIMHVGDTRVYLLADCQHIKKITSDHSKAAQLVAVGAITEEQAELHPDNSKLTQYIGMKNVNLMEPQFITNRIYGGELFILCSDGFRHMVSKAELTELFKNARSKNELNFAICSCMDLVSSRNEKDNITAIAIRVG